MQLSPENQRQIEEQKQHCIFCQIVKGEAQAQKVYEDDDFIAVLDINPGATGHTLFMPKEHYLMLPVVPPAVMAKMALLLPQLCDSLKKAVITAEVEAFIANGGAAGQQSSHFMMHLLPDKQAFHLPSGETDKTRLLHQQLKARFGTTNKDTLTRIIAENPELKKMIVENPDELIKNLPTAPDLARIFEGVDIHVLSQKLKEQETPRAVHLTDEQLAVFINSKEKLRDMIVSDPATLEMALETQPKLKHFFTGTTVAQIRERYLRGKSDV